MDVIASIQPKVNTSAGALRFFVESFRDLITKQFHSSWRQEDQLNRARTTVNNLAFDLAPTVLWAIGAPKAYDAFVLAPQPIGDPARAKLIMMRCDQQRMYLRSLVDRDRIMVRDFEAADAVLENTACACDLYAEIALMTKIDSAYLESLDWLIESVVEAHAQAVGISHGWPDFASRLLGCRTRLVDQL